MKVCMWLSWWKTSSVYNRRGDKLHVSNYLSVFSVVCFMLKHIALISMLCYYMSLHMLQLFAWCDICPLVILNYQTVEMLMLVKFSIRYGFLTCRNF
jgi:hypothetical protein